MKYENRSPIEGWEIENFTKNPKVVWPHNTSVPPIGKVLSVVRNGDGFTIEMEIYKSKLKELCDSVGCVA